MGMGMGMGMEMRHNLKIQWPGSLGGIDVSDQVGRL